jgi:hypothetical protein
MERRFVIALIVVFLIVTILTGGYLTGGYLALQKKYDKDNLSDYLTQSYSHKFSYLDSEEITPFNKFTNKYGNDVYMGVLEGRTTKNFTDRSSYPPRNATAIDLYTFNITLELIKPSSDATKRFDEIKSDIESQGFHYFYGYHQQKKSSNVTDSDTWVARKSWGAENHTITYTATVTLHKGGTLTDFDTRIVEPHIALIIEKDENWGGYEIVF